MSNNKQSSVEWLIEQLEEKGGAWENASIRRVQISIDVSEYLALKKQAKAIHKEEMINTINNISEKNIKYANNTIIALTKIKGELFMHDKKQAEQYYNEIFGGEQ